VAAAGDIMPTPRMAASRPAARWRCRPASTPVTGLAAG